MEKLGEATQTPTLLRVNDVAEKLGVNRNLVYKLISEKSLAALRVGRHLRVTEQAVNDFIARGGAR